MAAASSSKILLPVAKAGWMQPSQPAYPPPSHMLVKGEYKITVREALLRGIELPPEVLDIELACLDDDTDLTDAAVEAIRLQGKKDVQTWLQDTADELVSEPVEKKSRIFYDDIDLPWWHWSFDGVEKKTDKLSTSHFL